jgi:PAS domain-containing protein
MTVLQDQASNGQADDFKTLLALHAIAMSGMEHGVCVLDDDLRVVLFNRRCREILGLPAEAISLGTSLRAMLESTVDDGATTATSREKMWQDLTTTLAQRTEFNLRRRLPQGEVIRLHFQPVGAGGWVCTCGPAAAVVSQSEPSTLEYKTPESRTQLDQFDHAIETISQGLCLVDSEKRLVKCNQRFMEICGLDRSTLRPEMFCGDGIALAKQSGTYANLTIKDLIERQDILFRGEAVTQRLDLTDGRTIELDVRPVESGGWILELEDITTRISYERALHERNKLLDTALEHMAHGLCAYDEYLRVILVNRRYMEIYGLNPEEAKPGTPLVELMRRSI